MPSESFPFVQLQEIFEPLPNQQSRRQGRKPRVPESEHPFAAVAAYAIPKLCLSFAECGASYNPRITNDRP